MPDTPVSAPLAHQGRPTVCLLASAPTLEAIEHAIRRFWVSDAWTVDPETLAISHPEQGTPQGCRVVHKGRRFRFEMLIDHE